MVTRPTSGAASWVELKEKALRREYANVLQLWENTYHAQRYFLAYVQHPPKMAGYAWKELIEAHEDNRGLGHVEPYLWPLLHVDWYRQNYSTWLATELIDERLSGRNVQLTTMIQYLCHPDKPALTSRGTIPFEHRFILYDYNPDKSDGDWPFFARQDGVLPGRTLTRVEAEFYSGGGVLPYGGELVIDPTNNDLFL